MTSKEAADISTLSKIAGMLQAMACMEGATISKALAAELECRAERLEIYIAEQIMKDVKGHEEAAERAFDIIP